MLPSDPDISNAINMINHPSKVKYNPAKLSDLINAENLEDICAYKSPLKKIVSLRIK